MYRSAPLVRQLVVDLITAPVDVSITGAGRALTAGTTHQVSVFMNWSLATMLCRWSARRWDLDPSLC